MAAIPPGFVPLTRLSRVLCDRYRPDHPPTYDRLRRLVLDGLIDAETGPSNRSLVREADVPKVAALLGLAEPSP